MNYKKFFKVKSCSDLTINERLVYYQICWYANKDGIANISVQQLMLNTGIKDRHTISNITNNLVKKKYINKDYIVFDGCKRIAIYTVLNMDKDFSAISCDIMSINVSKVALVIAVSLADLTWAGSNDINMSNNEICKKIGISKPTFIKYIKELMSEGIVKRIEGGYNMDPHYFNLFTYKTKEAKESEKCLMGYPKDGRKYKTFRHYYDKDYAGVKNVEALLRSIENETFFTKNREELGKMVDHVPISFDF